MSTAPITIVLEILTSVLVASTATKSLVDTVRDLHKERVLKFSNQSKIDKYASNQQISDIDELREISEKIKTLEADIDKIIKNAETNKVKI